MTLQAELYKAVDELRSISNIGLHYKNHPGDVERYERVRAIAARLAALADGSDDEAMIRDTFEADWTHVTPIVGADVVVLRDGEMLLQKRADTGLWGLPGGTIDIGESSAEAALRELKEEVGISGEVVRLMGIYDSHKVGSRSKLQHYYLIFEVDSAEIPYPASSEVTEVAFFSQDNLPDLHFGHAVLVPMLFRQLHGELPIPYFDK